MAKSVVFSTQYYIGKNITYRGGCNWSCLGNNFFYQKAGYNVNWHYSVILARYDYMENTRPIISDINFKKVKFFLTRSITYASFLLIPILVPKSVEMNNFSQAMLMVFYIAFMASQWFMLGKEIDHRLGIYFKINSSFDRVVYRLFLGKFVIILYFNLLSFLPIKWIYNLFWTTWVVLGMFYSWPTRGKIIQESVTTYFGEFKYLDNFEKTILLMVVVLFFVSVPELPSLTSREALKLFFDPVERFSSQFWDFLYVNYIPFRKYPHLFKMAWSMHFYFVGIGTFLVTLYAFLRYFVSRRLSLLGVFALISSWSFSKILANNFGASIITTYSILWIWTLFWLPKSSSYRVGLFWGLVFYWGTIINQTYGLLSIIQLIFLYFMFFEEKTKWFKRQLIRYASLGIILTVITVLLNLDSFENLQRLDRHYISSVVKILYRKSFFILSYLGILIIILKFSFRNKGILKNFSFDYQKWKQLFIIVSILIGYAVVFDAYLIKSFSFMWFVVLLSLIPLELLFQSISRLRSSRNLIYLVYILICILDSHFEGRLKIFLRLFS